jgi:hypothetical protein
MIVTVAYGKYETRIDSANLEFAVFTTCEEIQDENFKMKLEQLLAFNNPEAVPASIEFSPSETNEFFYNASVAIFSGSAKYTSGKAALDRTASQWRDKTTSFWEVAVLSELVSLLSKACAADSGITFSATAP